MMTTNFNTAARWVCKRQKFNMATSVTEQNISQALAALEALRHKCTAPLMVADFFPGVALETLYIPSTGNNRSATQSQPFDILPPEARVTTPSLSAIGHALLQEMQTEGNDMVVHEFDDGSKAIAYLPEVRETVFKATGISLFGN